MTERRALSKWTLLAVLFVSLVLADQWTKYLAVARLTTVFHRTGADTVTERVRGFYTYRHLEPLSTPPHYVYRPLWRMNYVENPGAAWGLFRDRSEGFRNAFFSIVSLAAVAFILNYYRKVRSDQRFLQVALALVLAGAVGNFLDRIARGYVIDFVEWYWWNRTDLRWPTFNIADSLIVIGVAMLIVHPGPKKDAAAETSGDAERTRVERRNA
jgi:signal peptidase II